MESILISNVGFFWREDHVFWGAGSSAGSLLGVPAKNVTADVIDFREQSGIYVLYSDYKVLYVGQCGLGKQKLFTRLKQHRVDDLAERWDRSLGSAFVACLETENCPKRRCLSILLLLMCLITWRES